MKATIKSTGKIVEVVSRFMPKKKNAPSRDWMCNLSNGTCIDEKELEYINNEPVSEELEKAALEYETDNTIQTYDGGGLSPMEVVSLAEAFEAGANWQKEQMMKGAVEGIICIAKHEPPFVSLQIPLERWVSMDAIVGDKVKLIILPSDEQD